MKITQVEIFVLEKPLARPQRNSKGSRTSRKFTLVRVHCDQGLTGLGDAYGDQAIMACILRHRLAPAVLGADPRRIDLLWQRLFESRAFWEPGGSVLCGISALEVACWDLWAKSEGVPVCELLGGGRREWIPAYASNLHWDTPEWMAETAARYVEQGFTHVKCHVGAAGQFDNDLRRLEAIRQAIGPEAELMVDLNTGMDRQQALRFGRAIAPLRPFWLEEPLPPWDLAGHRLLEDELGYPVATGENLFTIHGFRPAWNPPCCRYLMPDVLRCGGLAQMQQIVREASAAGMSITPHNYSSGVGLAATLHLMAAQPEMELLEYDPTQTAIYEELFPEPPPVERGHVRVPERPGLGVELPEQTLQRYLVAQYRV